MRKNSKLHPSLNKIKIVYPDQAARYIYSPINIRNMELHLEMSHNTHIAWTKKSAKDTSNKKQTKRAQFFSNF